VPWRGIFPGIELSATVEKAGQPIGYEWDLDDDGSIDRTTTTGTTIIAGPDVASSVPAGTGDKNDVMARVRCSPSSTRCRHGCV